MDGQNRTGVAGERCLIIGNMRAIGRAHLAQPGPALLQDVGDTERAPDLDQFPPGDQDLAALECFFRPLRADGRGRLKGPPYDCRQARRGGSLKGRPTMRGSPKGGALRCAAALKGARPTMRGGGNATRD